MALIIACKSDLHAQTIKFIWQNALTTHMALDKDSVEYNTIRIRILSEKDSTNDFSLVFDKYRQNGFLETYYTTNRKLYQDYVEPDSDANLSSIDRRIWPIPRPEVDFTTNQISSAFPDFALGYGLYYICIETPANKCGTHAFFWDRHYLPVDFRDSRYANSYGSGSSGNIELHFALNDYQSENCGPQSFNYIHYYVPDIHQTTNASEGLPVYVEDLFDSGPPSYDFIIQNDLVPSGFTHNVLLTHSAVITGSGTKPYYIIPEYFKIRRQDIGLSWTKERDVTITVDGIAEFRANSTSTAYWDASGDDGSHKISFVTKTNPNRLSGLKFMGSIEMTLRYADALLDQPVYFDNAVRNNGALLTINRCDIEATNPDQTLITDGNWRQYCVLMNNVTGIISESSFHAVDKASFTTGIGISGDVRGSIIGANTHAQGNTIADCGAHGMELAEITLATGDRPKDVLLIESNDISNNRLYGVYARMGSTNAYFYNNKIHDNGWVGPDASEFQSYKCDGVNLQQACGVFRCNDIYNNGAYGLHAAAASNAYGWWKDLVYASNNCFHENYFNLGSNFNSTLEFGKYQDGNWTGHINYFGSPRSTYQLPNVFHTTLNNNSTAYLLYNVWNNPSLDTSASQIQKVSSILYCDPQLPSGIVVSQCGTNLTGSGGKNDSCSNCALLDQIDDDYDNRDWQALYNDAQQLLNANPTATEIVAAMKAFERIYAETGDLTAPAFVYNATIDTTNYNLFTIASYYGMKLFNTTRSADTSVLIASRLANFRPYSEHWKWATTNIAYVRKDLDSNIAAAVDYIGAVYLHYPDDAQVVADYVTICGYLPDSSLAKRTVRKSAASTDALRMSISPDPATSSLSILIEGIGRDATEWRNIELSIYDMTGRRVLGDGTTAVVAADSYRKSFDIAHLRSGTYLCKARIGGMSMVRCFVKIK
jgi:hypothetical protein